MPPRLGESCCMNCEIDCDYGSVSVATGEREGSGASVTGRRKERSALPPPNAVHRSSVPVAMMPEAMTRTFGRSVVHGSGTDL